MELEMPYFMTNKEWYKYDMETGRLVLTDKATDAAKQSYEEFYIALEDEAD